MFEYFAYETADLKNLLFDIDSACRGIGGVKQVFDYKSLPSSKKKQQEYIQVQPEQSEAQRLQRHKRFFEQMKRAYGPKKMTEEQKQAYIKQCQAPIVNDESKYDVEDYELQD